MPPTQLEALWQALGLPRRATASLRLVGQETEDPLASLFHIGRVAQTSIGAAALAAALYEHTRHQTTHCRTVTVDISGPTSQFVSERHFRINDRPAPALFDPLATAYKTKDGYIRLHTNWPHHKHAALSELGLPDNAQKDQVTAAASKVGAEAYTEAVMETGGVATMLRSFQEWEAHPQGRAVRSHYEQHGPVVRKELPRSHAPEDTPQTGLARGAKPLSGIRVLDMTRVIAGPTAGRTLALYGADVLLVTGPHLPSLPNLDCSTSLGKRTVQLDLRKASDRDKLSRLIKEADVVLQAYRPKALAALGLSFDEVSRLNPRIVYASLSAWNDQVEGPWSERRGFDSLVQHATGFGVAEAFAFSQATSPGTTPPADLAPRPLPAQALDYASGYLLAFGIISALYHREVSPSIGPQRVDVSLAGVGLWTRSFGQRESWHAGHDAPTETLQQEGKIAGTTDKEGAKRTWVKHAAVFEGLEAITYDRVPTGLACDEPEWLPR